MKIIEQSTAIKTISLTFGNLAKIYSDGEVLIELSQGSPYFVLSKDDIKSIVRETECVFQ